MAVEASTTAYGRAAPAVTGAIRNAASTTGTSFSYLLATAKIESDLNPTLTMKSSSAAGLFQFIDQTWLGTLKQAGPAFGYGNYANAITRTSSGRYVVADPQMRKAIQQLKNDPTANAIMAGVLTQQNAAALSRRIGRAPTENELYIAHFLGAGGAGELIRLTGSEPQASAAAAFPAAAQANHSIFYDRAGNARSVSGVYAEISRRFKVAGDAAGASVAGGVVPPMLALTSPPSIAKSLAPVTDVAGTARVFAAASAASSAASPAAAQADSAVPAAASAPRFSSLFSDAGRRSAIDPTVVALWSDAASRQAAIGGATADDNTGGFDLFSDPRAAAVRAGGNS
ncbi:MAG TPA: lytic transglycosylase domain-containing protein [Xanthobacteraceae bacterium]|nr:lytic transglycosylase domain-containing protein [Xanthobacteraceae bacterium]